jgi:hypothetical protein
LKKRPSPHIHKVPTRSNKVSPGTFQTALVYCRGFHTVEQCVCLNSLLFQIPYVPATLFSCHQSYDCFVGTATTEHRVPQHKIILLYPLQCQLRVFHPFYVCGVPLQLLEFFCTNTAISVDIAFLGRHV